jgi:general transcription factor 3C polypeptide 3 (transcription factor C subunit 4)
LLLGDERRVFENSQFFLHKAPYAVDSHRLFSLANRMLRSRLSWYASGPEQKYLMRRVKDMDYALMSPAQRKKADFTLTEITRVTQSGTNDGNAPGFENHSASLLALYGHMMLAQGSCASSLAYYYRAYALVPDSPIVNLCMAISYFAIAFKRQTDNRQLHVQQGLAFLQKYRELRSEDGIAIHEQEAEFNVALAWQSLGLNHLAIKSYERVLELSDRVRAEARQGRLKEGREGDGGMAEDFAPDAAFALQSILAFGKDLSGAKAIGERWLTL